MWQNSENVSGYNGDGVGNLLTLYRRVQHRSVFSGNLIFPVILVNKYNLCKLKFVNKTNSENLQDVGNEGRVEEHLYFLSAISNRNVVKSFCHLGNIDTLVFHKQTYI